MEITASQARHSAEFDSAEALAAANRRAADLLGLFDSHFSRSPVGFACWDAELRCVRTNEALSVLTSCSPEGCCGQPMARVLPELAGELGELCREVFRTRQARINVEIASPPTEPPTDAPSRCWLASVYPTIVTHGANAQGAMATVLAEITDHKRSQGDLNAIVERITGERDEAVRAGLAQNRCMPWVSHELATPVLPVHWELQNLLEAESTPASMRPKLQRMLDCVKVQMTLINDLKDQTRLGSNKLALSLEPVDAHALVRQALQTVQPEIAEAKLVLESALGAELCHVSGDRRRLLQVLWNLVRNAIKFTPAGGKIAVSSMNRSRHADARVQPDLVIEVRDTGTGIDPANLERVFLAFEQESMGTVRSQGLGLGLTISRALAELHGGRLVAQSEGKGKGSVFTLTLPTVLPPVEAKTLAPSS